MTHIRRIIKATLSFRYLLLPCGDSVLAAAVESSLIANSIKYPSCPVCEKPVPFLHRLKRELNGRKKLIMKVVDNFFALKSSGPKLKKELLSQLEGNN